jgi:hypothetical protein
LVGCRATHAAHADYDDVITHSRSIDSEDSDRAVVSDNTIF